MNNIHTIRIKADAADTNDPRDYQSGEGVKIRRNDDCNFEVTFFNRGEMLDMSDIVSATLEILEIGERNSAAPRETKVALRKTLSAAELDASLDAEDFESGSAHAKFVFGSADTSIPAGEKWLKIYLISDDNRKTTFSSGWIDFLENYGENAEDPEDIGYPALLTQSAAEAIFAKKSSNLADLADTDAARTNIGAAADAEVLKKSDNLLSVQNPTTARTNIGAAADADVLKKNSNLADVANAATARSNIGAASASEFNAALLRTKNIGTFGISYGAGLGLARPLDRLPLSVCFRIKISSQTVGDIYAGNEGVITDSTAAGFCLYKISASQSSLVVGGGAYAGATVSFDDSTLADGNWHAVAIVLNSNGKVFVDGELVATSSNFSSGLARFTSPGQFYFGKSSGGRFELSNMKAFNFDISASGAPYTVAKSAAGEEPPPALSHSVIFGDKNYNIYYRSNASNNYDVASNVLTFFQASGNSATLASLLFNVDFPVPIAAGKSVKITYDSITGDAVQNSGGVYAYISFYNSSSQYVLGDAQLTNLSGETIVKTQTANYASRKLDRVCVYVYTTASSESDQTIKINGLRIEVDGMLLNLSDSANAYQARDLSANGNHATLLGGSVAGKSAVPAQMNGRHYWGAEVSTGAYMLADSEVLPANSQVEILAKANAAATLDIGSSASSTSEYASSASVGTTLSSVATFYTGGVPTKLFITPSIAGLKLEYAIKVNEI